MEADKHISNPKVSTQSPIFRSQNREHAQLNSRLSHSEREHTWWWKQGFGHAESAALALWSLGMDAAL